MAGDTLTFRVAFVVRWLLWVVRFVIIRSLVTVVLMVLLILWKDDITLRKLPVKEINFIRQAAPAGQFPVSECWFFSFGLLGGSEIQDTHHYRAADAAGYVREIGRSLMQLVTAFWAALALTYISFMAGTGKYSMWPGKMKCVRVGTVDEHLKEVYTEDAFLPEKIRKCPAYLHDDRTSRNNGDKNEHA